MFDLAVIQVNVNPRPSLEQSCFFWGGTNATYRVLSPPEKKLFEGCIGMGHGGHVGQVALTVRTTFCSLSPRRLYMNFVYNRTSGF